MRHIPIEWITSGSVLYFTSTGVISVPKCLKLTLWESAEQ